jgi:uncharacterized protein (TIGR02996 family)
MREYDFLQSVLAEPKDDALLKVYSDWLEEQGDPASALKAEFLRITVTPPAGKGGKKKRDRRLQQLAADLDTDWLAVVSRMKIENCGKKRETAPLPHLFNYLCDRRWEDLQTTGEIAVRHCEGCKENVHYCDTITEARNHARKGHCIAVDLGVIRRDGDLRIGDLMMGVMGRISATALKREEELAKPDPVSAERERRKRKERRETAAE